MWQRLQGLEVGIESFWAGLPLGYGLFVTDVVLTCWVGLFAWLSKATGRQAWWPVLYLMIVASTSAGLASKTPMLGQLVALTVLFLAQARASASAGRQPSGAKVSRSASRTG